MSGHIGIVKLDELKEHEEIELAHLQEIKKQIEQDGFLKDPIVVDKNTKIILDGHHRYNALKQLNCSKIVAYFVDYNSSRIKVRNWKKGKKIIKKSVIKAGLTGKKLPPKTTRHLIPNKPSNLNVPLKNLM
jgi:uridine kinase